MLIAGKGHEKYQQIGDRVLPFDDGEVARAALASAGRTGRRQVSGSARFRSRPRRLPARWAAGWLPATAEHYVTGFSIDSRTLASGDLFFAIVAARDGHDFLGAAFKRGAAGVVVSRPIAVPDEAESFVIEVADTTRGLQDLARFVRRKSGARVVAITGSAGKTTTKDAIAELLSARYRVVKNRGNLNNHLGLPLSLLELRHGADVAVMELGMNHAGEIRMLVNVATPEVRVWTNVGDAHIGHFGSADAIADAKAEILESASSDDLLVANADDPRVMARVPAFAGRRVTFGLNERADVRAVDVEDLGLAGSRARLVTSQGEREIAGAPARPRPPLERARGRRRRPRDGRRSRPRRRHRRHASAIGPPRRGAAAAQGRHGDRRLLQLQPIGAEARARRAGPHLGGAPHRRARRDARARRSVDRAARGVRPRGGRQRR